MNRRKRLSTVLNVVAMLVLATSLLTSGLSWPMGSPPTVAAAAQELSLESTRQAYELLLDRFVYPLAPAPLLVAAWEAGVPALKEAGSTADLSIPEFPEQRQAAWRVFTERVQTAWDASAGLDPPTKVTHAMIRGMAMFASEGHTAFRTPAEYQEYLAWQRNDERYEGIGVSFRGKNYVILEVFPGSPAEAAGLRSGDQILGADGFNLQGTELDEGRRRIRGPSGTQVELLIKRGTQADPFTIIVPRAQIRIDPVRWRIIDGNIGYLRIIGFPHPAVATDVDRALQEFDKAGVKGVALDLRGNGGGRLDVGKNVASKFIKDGPLFEQVSRDGRQRTEGTIGGYWDHSVPVAVLTDGGTASMGEILASAMRENDAATIFGAKTAGVVSAAQVFPLVDGAALQVTVLEIRSGLGVKMNEIGLSPNVAVEFTPTDAEEGKDPQLDRALLWLQTHPKFLSASEAQPTR